jgi:hypothetical protein
MSAIESESVNGYTIEIHHDMDAESPRDRENVFHLLMKRRGYTLPWECDEDFDPELYGIQEVAKAVTRRHDAAYVFPIWCYEHSLIAYRAGDDMNPFSDNWDSGLVGLAYVTNAMIDEQRPYFPADWDAAKWAKEVIDGELDTYTDWGNGATYGFVITDPLGDEVESCWGFYGDDALDEARSIVEGLPAVKGVVVPA